MSDGQDNIRRSVQAMIKKMIPPQAIICKVTAVDKATSTCDVEPLNGDAEIFGVKLQADETADFGVIPIPAIDSNVIVQFLDKSNAFVSLIAQIESYLIKINDITLSIDANGIELNGEDLGGLIKISDLVTKLNNIESDLNTLKGIFSSWVPVASDGGAALKALLSSYSTSSLTPTVNPDLENTKVKHGSN